MRRISHAQLAEYDNWTFHETRVEAIEPQGGTFRVRAGATIVDARRVLLCVGLVDELPDLPGYRELWGTRIFQCPNCHAWEVRDQAFGYFAPNNQCADWSLLLRGWTRDLVVFTDGKFEVSPDVREDFARAQVRLEAREVVGIRRKSDERLAVQLADGTEIVRDVVFARPPQRMPALVTALGLDLESPDVVRTTKYETSIPGVFAAGDLMRREHGALIAAASGAAAAHQLDEGLTRELVLAGLR